MAKSRVSKKKVSRRRRATRRKVSRRRGMRGGSSDLNAKIATKSTPDAFSRRAADAAAADAAYKAAVAKDEAVKTGLLAGASAAALADNFMMDSAKGAASAAALAVPDIIAKNTARKTSLMMSASAAALADDYLMDSAKKAASAAEAFVPAVIATDKKMADAFLSGAIAAAAADDVAIEAAKKRAANAAAAVTPAATADQKMAQAFLSGAIAAAAANDGLITEAQKRATNAAAAVPIAVTANAKRAADLQAAAITKAAANDQLMTNAQKRRNNAAKPPSYEMNPGVIAGDGTGTFFPMGKYRFTRTAPVNGDGQAFNGSNNNTWANFLQANETWAQATMSNKSSDGQNVYTKLVAIATTSILSYPQMTQDTRGHSVTAGKPCYYFKFTNPAGTSEVIFRNAYIRPNNSTTWVLLACRNTVLPSGKKSPNVPHIHSFLGTPTNDEYMLSVAIGKPYSAPSQAP